MVYQPNSPGGGATAETVKMKTKAVFQLGQGTNGDTNPVLGPAQVASSGQGVVVQQKTLAAVGGGQAGEEATSPARSRQHSVDCFDDETPCRESDQAADDVVGESPQDDEVRKMRIGGGGR